MVPYDVRSLGRRLPPAAGAVPTAVKYDMQGDTVEIAAMGLGTSRVSPTMESRRVQLGEEAHHPYECFMCGYASGHHCQVLLSLPFSWIGANSCPLKVHDGAFLVEQSLLPVCQMLRVPPKSPHARDRMVKQLNYVLPKKRS